MYNMCFLKVKKLKLFCDWCKQYVVLLIKLKNFFLLVFLFVKEVVLLLLLFYYFNKVNYSYVLDVSLSKIYLKIFKNVFENI